MANITTFFSDKLLDHLLGKTSYTMPTIWVGLSTTTPTLPAGTGFTEPSGNAYARVQLSPNTAAAAAESASTNAVLTFAQATGSWGTITYMGFFDASTVGNLLAAAALTVAETVNSGDTFSFPSGNITATLT
jgi:hypothetical protein